jgi:hypothetical protein
VGAHAGGVEPDVFIDIEYDILHRIEVDRVGLDSAESGSTPKGVLSDEIVDSVVNSRLFFVYLSALFRVEFCGKIYVRPVH